MRLVAPSAEVLTWNARTGEAGAEPVPGTIDPPAAGLLREVHTLLNTAGLAPSRWFPEPLGLDLPDSERARRAAEAAVASASSWSADLRDPTIAPGDLIRPPSGSGPDEDLLVVARELRYNPRRPPGEQLVNRVTALPAAAAVPAPPLATGSLTWAIGQVARVDDPQGYGRVKLRLPAHAARGSDPAAWDGVWCPAPQLFGGANVQGKRHGSLVLPAPWIGAWP